MSTPPCQWERRIASCNQDEMQWCRQMIEEESHRLVNLGQGQNVIVFQDQQIALRKSSCIIEQQREHRFEIWQFKWGLLNQREQRMCRASKSLLEDLTSENDRMPETERIVVSCIKREPGDRRSVLAFAERGNPLADQRRFAVSGRSRHQCELAQEPLV